MRAEPGVDGQCVPCPHELAAPSSQDHRPDPVWALEAVPDEVVGSAGFCIPVQALGESSLAD
eukprot:5509408-Alexandrium_andersonii.AAC.1